MKRALRRMTARLMPATASPGTRVLLYHSVDEPDPADRMGLRVPLQRFREQMAWLAVHGVRVVPLDRVLSPPPESPPQVAITFDDGYQGIASAWRVLQEFGHPATCFVVPRFLDGLSAPQKYWEAWKHLGWDELGSLAAQGLAVGGHSFTHPDLRLCPGEQLEREVAGSRALLERRLGCDVNSFSYPHGRHDARVRDTVERAGYRLACTSRYCSNVPPVSPFAVGRTEVTGTDTLEDFRWKLQGKYDWLRHWQDVKSA